MTTTHDGRFVFDTNVLISALLFTNSTPGQAWAVAMDRGDILISLPLQQELQAVLARPKFERYVTREEREQFLASLTKESSLTTLTVELHVCRDPKDDHLLELAVSGQATCIVTGDADLLTLHPFQGIDIVTPAAFVVAYALGTTPT